MRGPSWLLAAAAPVGQDEPMGVIRFRAQLQPRGPAAAVILDDGQVAEVGAGAKRFPVVATVELDTAPWEVEVPEALAAALAASPDAAAAFERLAFTHRKEYARWVAEAKREETRDRRVQQALEMLRTGQTLS
jgi:Bacteriocin-protection, YdeI or OmpD-Associated